MRHHDTLGTGNFPVGLLTPKKAFRKGKVPKRNPPPPPWGGVPFWMFWEAKKKITTWYFQNFPLASDYCKWPSHLNPCLLLEGVTLWSLTLGSAVSRFLWPCGIVWKHLDTSGLNQRDGREKKRKWQDTGHHQITSASEASKGLKLLKICWTMLNSCNEVRQETGEVPGGI